MFTQDQFKTSLRATFLEEPLLRASFIVDTRLLHSDILAAQQKDSVCLGHIKNLTSVSSVEPSSRWSLGNEGILLFDQRIWVPTQELQIRVLQQHHDHPIGGHFGQHRTLQAIRRFYVWPEIRTFVRDYVRSCVTCKRNKAPRHRPYGLLQPLPVPDRPWHSISMDFVEELPKSNGFNSLLVIVDRASKQTLLIPTTTSCTSLDLARLFLYHVFAKHGLPKHITSGRGSEFVSIFMRSLGEILGMTLHFTSGYHPEGDGQTERANQTIEAYIRMYCSYQQDDWSEWLGLAEFAYNSTENATTGITPFFANKGYEPYIGVDIDKDVGSTRAKHFAADLNKVHEYLCETLTEARERYKEIADRSRLPTPDLKIGDSVFVLAKHIPTTRPTAKFAEKYLGPFEILGHPSRNAFLLKLPRTLQGIHPVFHISQLEPHTPNPFPSRTDPPPQSVIIDGEQHYEISGIVDSKLDRRYKCRLRYKVEFTGYEDTDDRYDWQGADELLETAKESIEEFHLRYPNKPGPLETLS